MTTTQIASELQSAIEQKDHAKINAITSQYGSEERAKIAAQYLADYGKSLKQAIDKNFKDSSWEDLILCCWDDQASIRANWIAKALARKTDHRMLLDTIILCDGPAWNRTAEAYNQLHGRSLVIDLKEKLKDETAEFYSAWTQFQRQGLSDIDNEAKRYSDAIAAHEDATVIEIICGTEQEDYKKVVEKFREVAKKTIPQALSVVYTGPLYWALLTAHYRNIDLTYGAAFLMHHAATADKRGDVDRAIRITSLCFDRCLTCRTYYREFGSMLGDAKKAYPAWVADALAVIWRLS
ncbi:Alpha-3 giardin [Giardia muris]|nr:Alpha-3 giardin [Giardia muris]|eukprot:TNJ26542.1 Alpha-3 giardin [Giardia muris]